MKKVAAVLSVLLVLSMGLAGSFVVVTGTVEAGHTSNSPTDVVVVNASGGIGVTNTTIQAGINHANSGDIVFVESETYNESVVVNKTDLTIATNESVTLNGSTVTGPAFNVTSAEGNVSNVEISGFTIANYETGVSVDGVEGPPDDATLDMRNVSVLNNTFQDISGTAVSVDHESGEFERVTIGDNTITNATDGVSVSVDGSASTENVTVGANSMGGEITGSAVSLSAGGSTTLTDVNVVLNNGSESGTGLDVSLQDSASLGDVNVSSNEFISTDGDAISLATGSTSTSAAGISSVEIGANLLNDSDSGAGVNVTTRGSAAVDDITVDTVLGNGGTDGVIFEARGSSDISGVEVTGSLLRGSTNSALSLAGAGGTVQDVTVDSNGLNASGSGLRIAASAGGSVSNVSVTENNASRGSDGLVIVSEGTSSTVEGVDVTDTLLNETTGTGVSVSAGDSSEVTDVSFDTVDASGNAAGLEVYANDSANVANLSASTAVFGESAGDAGVLRAGFDGTSTAAIENVTFSSVGFNESGGTGLSLLAQGDGIDDVSLDTVDARNNQVGLDVSAASGATIANLSTDTASFGESATDAGVLQATDATIEDVTFASTGFNESGGTGLALSADDGTVRNVSLDTVTAGNNTVGIDASATGTGTISGISTDTALFGESDGNAGVFEAIGAGATVKDLAFELTGFNQSAGTGLVLSANDGTVRNVSLDTVTAGNNDVGINATATGAGTISGISTDTALFGESDADAGVFEAVGADATVEDLAFELTGFNKSGGTGLVLSANDGTVQNISMDTVIAGDNTNGIDATATGTGTISGISTDTALFGESDGNAGVFEAIGADATVEDLAFELTGFNKSGGTGLTLLADDGTVRNVSLDTVIASDNTVGANVTAAAAGTIRNVSANTVLFSGNDDGLRLGAVDDASVEDVRIVRSGLNETTNALVFDGDGGSYSGVRVVESLIRQNDIGVLITPDTSTEGLRVKRSLIANNLLGVDNRNDTGVFDARTNWWGNSSGPSSATGGDTPYADPVNGKLATGDGDSVSEGATPGVSNVRFDPAIGGKNRNEEDGQIFDPVAIGEGQNINQLPEQFSVDIAGVTIEGPISDFVGLNVWERSALPLRGDDDDAANKVRNAQVFIRTNEGDVSINRDFLKVYQAGQSLNVTFREVNGANTTRFANEEVQFHVFRANDTSNLSGAFTRSINETTGEVSVGSDDVEIVELRDLGQLDGSGEVSLEFTPDRPGEYLFALTTVESGDGFELNEAGTGRLEANVLNDSTVFAGFEAITVQETDSAVTPESDSVVTGERLNFTAQSNLASNDVDHAILLYDRAAFENKLVFVNDTSLTTSGDDVIVNVTGTADGEPFLVSINATTQDCDPTNSSIPTSIEGAEEDPCVNDITTSGAIEGVPSTARVVLSGNSTETLNLAAPTNVSFDGEEKTFQYVHAAAASDNVTSRSTDVGTITVEKQVSELVVEPPQLSFGVRSLGSSTTRTITVTNNGTGPANLTSVSITGTNAGQFAIASGGPTALAPGENTTLDVVFEPTSPGTLVAQLEIDTNETDSPTVFVPLSGTAATPQEPLEIETILSTPAEYRFQIRNLRASQFANLSTTDLGDANVSFGDVNVFTSSSVSVANEIDVRIQRTTTVPSGVPALTGAGDVAQYLNVTADGIDDGDVESVRFRFRVSEDRLGDRDPENVAFYRFNDGAWSRLDVTFLGTTDDGFNQFVGISPGFSAFAVALQEPELAITDTTLDPESVLTGENATASATIENTGSAGENFTAGLTVDGGLEDTRTVFVPAGETRTVDFTVSFAAAGAYDLAINGTTVGTLTVSEPPTISVDPASVDFGGVNLGDSATESVTVTNDGGVDLELTSTAIAGADAGDFTITSAGASTLAPGENTTVEIAFTPGSGGAKSAQLEIGSNDPSAPTTTVPLAGTGEPVPDIARSPTSISFGTVTTVDSTTRTVLIANFGDAPLDVTSTTITGMDDGEFTIVETPSSTVAPGEQTMLRIEFAPGSIGPKMGQLEIETNDPDEGLVTVPLIGMGAGVPEISVSTMSVDFGTVTVGDSATEDATVTNTGNANLTLTSVSVTGPDADAFSGPGADTPITLAPGEEVTGEVTFSPTTAGEKTATLRIESDDPAQPATLIALSGTGEALPDIEVDPASVDFGEVTVGETATDSVSVSNDGGAPLDLSSVSVTGSDAGAFSVTDSGDGTIAPGESTTVELEFAPDSEGDKSAQLEIESSDPDEGTVTVDLSGTGTVTTTTEPPVTTTAPPPTTTEPPVTTTAPPPTTTEPPDDGGPPVVLIVIVIVLIVVGIVAALYFRGGPGSGG